MTYIDIYENILRKKSFLCVGLDPDLSKMPSRFADYDVENAIFEFNKGIIDATAKYAIAFKPNLAFYECHGISGMKAFERTVNYIRKHYPDQFIIADAKRGDIGNTSRKYADAFFTHYDVDALTVAPYMGHDSITPFLGFEGKWVIVLALTSNPGANDFQLVEDQEGTKLFEKVIEKCNELGSLDNIMFVTGATRADRLREIRHLAPRNFLLVPGIGAQGGSLEEVMENAMTDECGLIVNASRSILYASSGEDFADAAADEARRVQTAMAAYIQNRL